MSTGSKGLYGFSKVSSEDAANQEGAADGGGGRGRRGEGGRKEPGGAGQRLTKPRQVGSQGTRLWKTNLETLSHKISIEDIKPRGAKQPTEERRLEQVSQRLSHSVKSEQLEPKQLMKR